MKHVTTYMYAYNGLFHYSASHPWMSHPALLWLDRTIRSPGIALQRQKGLSPFTETLVCELLSHSHEEKIIFDITSPYRGFCLSFCVFVPFVSFKLLSAGVLLCVLLLFPSRREQACVFFFSLFSRQEDVGRHCSTNAAAGGESRKLMNDCLSPDSHSSGPFTWMAFWGFHGDGFRDGLANFSLELVITVVLCGHGFPACRLWSHLNIVLCADELFRKKFSTRARLVQ